ncbi:MAG TPA: hypothetical protein VHW09_29260 [Bryobacteraceae bacterium]|jgi:hypothetical protein|nr:hypothetical protein [Bryobacteraceae bacterium]
MDKKIVRIYVHSKGGGSEITVELEKHPGWEIEAVFPLGHVHHSEDYREFFVLLRPHGVAGIKRADHAIAREPRPSPLPSSGAL